MTLVVYILYHKIQENSIYMQNCLQLSNIFWYIFVLAYSPITKHTSLSKDENMQKIYFCSQEAKL